MKLTSLMILACAALSVSACGPPGVATDALFKDVSRKPPDARQETVDAIAKDREFAEWVVYQDRLCEIHGCSP